LQNKTQCQHTSEHSHLQQQRMQQHPGSKRHGRSMARYVCNRGITTTCTNDGGHMGMAKKTATGSMASKPGHCGKC
jgi:hypothetical protein